MSFNSIFTQFFAHFMQILNEFLQIDGSIKWICSFNLNIEWVLANRWKYWMNFGKSMEISNEFAHFILKLNEFWQIDENFEWICSYNLKIEWILANRCKFWMNFGKSMEILNEFAHSTQLSLNFLLIHYKYWMNSIIQYKILHKFAKIEKKLEKKRKINGKIFPPRSAKYSATLRIRGTAELAGCWPRYLLSATRRRTHSHFIYSLLSWAFNQFRCCLFFLLLFACYKMFREFTVNDDFTFCLLEFVVFGSKIFLNGFLRDWF